MQIQRTTRIVVALIKKSQKVEIVHLPEIKFSTH